MNSLVNQLSRYGIIFRLTFINDLIGQPYGKGGSFIQSGRHLYLALVLFDALAGNHQAKTGTAVPFGAEK
jgi:hypothetical protein